MKIKKSFFIISIILLSFIITGCIKIKTVESDGGVFKSNNFAEHWEKKNYVLTLLDEKNSLDNVDITNIVLDPQDSNTLYVGTTNSGGFVSFDSAESWLKIKNLPKGKINSIVVDPAQKHIVYIAVDNQIFKTTDALRTWENIYLGEANIKINVLHIDPTQTSRIYAGFSDGRMIKSDNQGSSWHSVYRFSSAIKQILIDPSNSNIIYLITLGHGMYKSNESGITWQSLKVKLKDYPGGNDVIKIIFDLTKQNTLISINKYGLLKTEDGGETWVDYDLLSSSQGFKAHGLGIDPKDPNIIYYSVYDTIYKSIDNGQNWTTISIPSKRIPKELLINPDNTNVLYIGLTKEKK